LISTATNEWLKSPSLAPWQSFLAALKAGNVDAPAPKG